MRNEREESEAAKRAWALFERTGSIQYYMLYHDIMRKG